MLSPIPCFSAGFFLSSLPLQLLPSKHGQLTLLTSPFSFSSRSFLPLQDFPSLHFPVPNSSKTPSHRFPKLLFIPCSLLTLPTFLLFFLSRLHPSDFPTASLFGKIPPHFSFSPRKSLFLLSLSLFLKNNNFLNPHASCWLLTFNFFPQNIFFFFSSSSSYLCSPPTLLFYFFFIYI